MRKRISSSWTYFYKRIFPALWIIGFGTLTVWLWIGNWKGQGVQPGGLRWIALLAWGGGAGFLLWYSRMLKEVWLYEDQLIVSDYYAEERVPLRQVEEVKETRFWNPKLIRLRLRRAGRWGNCIAFIAPLRFQFVFMDHPLAGELRALVSEAQTRGIDPDLRNGRAGRP
jgi:hypothetical protein